MSGSIFGLLAVTTIDAGNGVLAALSAAWLMLCGTDLGFTWRQFRRVRRLRLNADLELMLEIGGLGWQPARVLDGTAALGDIVWLRYCESGGRKGAELLFGKRRACHGWRRFAVILRLAEKPLKRL